MTGMPLKLPARLALLAVVLASGCATSPRQLEQLARISPPGGVHAVAVKPLAGWTRLEWISVLPGDDPAAGCPMQTLADSWLVVRACSDADASAWLASLTRAQQAMQTLLPDWQPSRWEVDLLPAGQPYRARHVRWSRPPQVPLHLAFSQEQPTERAQRRAVRTLAHESFHVLQARRGVQEVVDAEYNASLAGRCIEFAVFGSVPVEQWEPEALDVLADGLDPAQRQSLAGHLQASARLGDFLTPQSGGADGLLAFCRQVLAGEGA